MNEQQRAAAAIVLAALDGKATEFHDVSTKLAHIRRRLAGSRGAPAWLAACERHGSPEKALEAAWLELREVEERLAGEAAAKVKLALCAGRLEGVFVPLSIRSALLDQHGSQAAETVREAIAARLATSEAAV